MLVFGITGGSGSGKSSASERFRENGIYVIDADKTAREVVRQGEPCLEELVKELGSEILNDDGGLNRRKTGDIVFSDKKSWIFLIGSLINIYRKLWKISSIKLIRI